MNPTKAIAAARDALGGEAVEKILAMNEQELQEFSEKIQTLIEKKRMENKPKSPEPSREEILRQFAAQGYYPSVGTKFYRIDGTKGKGKYGMKVGEYTHSCHVDTSDIIVLLVLDADGSHVEEYMDLWVTEKFTV